MNGIVAEVERRGRLSCAEYMELAHFHPEFGYHARARGLGPAGGPSEALAAPPASPVLASTLARLLARLAELLGEPLCLAEVGAGQGRLTSALLEALGRGSDEVVRRVVAVERSAWGRQRLAETCPAAEVAERLSDLPRPAGPAVLLTSELYSALPVHRVVQQREGELLVLRELYVEARAAALHWADGPLSDAAVAAYLEGHGVSLREGQRAEVRLVAGPLHARHLAWLGLQGLVLVFDHGHPANRLYDPRSRRDGTLAGVRGHRVVHDVLREPGECDIIAGVNFDDLVAAAAQGGWESEPPQPLGVFLAGAGALEVLPPALARGEPLTPEAWAELAAARRLLARPGMGADLKVLAQGRGRVWGAYRALGTLPPANA
ncbi:MAG TPA: SAM-dependent methyltransferase [Thermoanaerobaculaceae bacterium]|nr:SAM-dependent methyltransferase [Thermoanaerobaculaceae bacterium]HRS17474.1 SAM-dependent methyltransferase [Thermoanaerobaculaceae bacterium]